MPAGFRPFVSPDGEAGPITGRTADLTATIEDVTVTIHATAATLVIEGSANDDDWVTVADLTVVGASSYMLDHRLPYYRVRVVDGTVTARYGPTQGRNRELGSVSSPMTALGGPQ